MQLAVHTNHEYYYNGQGTKTQKVNSALKYLAPQLFCTRVCAGNSTVEGRWGTAVWQGEREKLEM